MFTHMERCSPEIMCAELELAEAFTTGACPLRKWLWENVAPDGLTRVTVDWARCLFGLRVMARGTPKDPARGMKFAFSLSLGPTRPQNDENAMASCDADDLFPPIVTTGGKPARDGEELTGAT